MNIFRSTSTLYVSNKTGEIDYDMKDKSKEIRNINLLDVNGNILYTFESRVVEKYDLRRQTLWIGYDIKTKKVFKDIKENVFLMKSDNRLGGYDLYIPFSKWFFVCTYSTFKNTKIHDTMIFDLFKININDIEINITRPMGYIGEDLSKEYNECFEKVKSNNESMRFSEIDECIEKNNENLILLEKCKGILQDSKDMYEDMVNEFVENFKKNGRLE